MSDRTGGILTPSELDRLSAAMAWTQEIAPLNPCETPSLSSNVLNLTTAANKEEVQTELQTIVAKLNEIISAINLMKPQ